MYFLSNQFPCTTSILNFSSIYSDEAGKTGDATIPPNRGHQKRVCLLDIARNKVPMERRGRRWPFI